MPSSTQAAVRRAAIASRLSTPRLTPYLTATGGNLKEALRLYDWNVMVSGAFYESLHQFEVVLRNAIDDQLCAWNATQTERGTGRRHSRDWLMDPAHLLRRLTRDNIPKAQQRAQTALRGAGRTPGHADVLAQLSFGTWRYLLPDRDSGRQLLWRQAISLAFPQLTFSARDLVTHVDQIHKLRNRIAHLEPLLDGAMITDRFASMRAVASAIDPIAENWIISRQRVTPVFRDRPLPRPSRATS
jgi:hypothetical protein